MDILTCYIPLCILSILLIFSIVALVIAFYEKDDIPSDYIKIDDEYIKLKKKMEDKKK